jgi:hypothetical protein
MTSCVYACRGLENLGAGAFERGGGEKAVPGRRESVRPREAKVRELQRARAVEQQVLGLEVAVQDPALVAERDAAEDLVHEGRADAHVEACGD